MLDWDFCAAWGETSLISTVWVKKPIGGSWLDNLQLVGFEPVISKSGNETLDWVEFHEYKY